MPPLARSLAFVLLFLLPTQLHAESAATKGEAIADAAAEQGKGFGDSSVSGEMILYTKSGRQSVRKFRSSTLEGRGNDPSANLIVFEWPGDVRNTALLTHAYDDKPDDQWLYLPAIGRVKRISSSARSGSFMGSEFAYEDMVDQGVDEYTHIWVRDEPCPGSGGTCHVLDRMPKGHSGYARQRVWMNAKHLYVEQVQYFGRGNRLVKTLTASGYRQYLGRYWRATRLRMQNQLTGKSTDLTWHGFKFKNGYSMRDFSVQALKQSN